MATEHIETLSSALCETVYQTLVQTEGADIAAEVMLIVIPLLRELSTYVAHLAREQQVSARKTESRFASFEPLTLEFLMSRYSNPVSGELAVHKSAEAEALMMEERRELANTLGPQTTKRIEKVIKALSPNEALVILARELFDMSTAELAGSLYKTEVNIRKAYSQGKRRLGEKAS